MAFLFFLYLDFWPIGCFAFLDRFYSAVLFYDNLLFSKLTGEHEIAIYAIIMLLSRTLIDHGPIFIIFSLPIIIITIMIGHYYYYFCIYIYIPMFLYSKLCTHILITDHHIQMFSSVFLLAAFGTPLQKLVQSWAEYSATYECRTMFSLESISADHPMAKCVCVSS